VSIFTVTNLSDSGLGSLRQAIQDSNNMPGADTINFANSLSSKIINLSTGQLTITDSLTINGLGANLLKIEGGNRGFRIFNIDNGTTSRIDVSINGLTITGGNPTRDGGGIYSRVANLTVSDSIISGNTVNGNTTDDVDGGGIYSKLGSLKVINSTISGNAIAGYTPDGGGIYSIDEDLTIINSTISGNTVNGLRLDSGGGIYSARGNVTVIDSTISNNSASADPRYDSADGGGIFSRDGNLTVTNSTISGNSASGAKTDGGGLYSKDGNLTVTNSTISGNSTSVRGGGIFSIRGQLRVANSTISGNSATNGGGIFNSATFNATNTIIANSISGGDCFNSGSVATNSNNLIEDGSCNPALSGDPNLSPLQNNGGPTLTHALLLGSIAINAGNNTYTAGLVYDQRGSGFNRIIGGLVDIGAYEVQPPQNHLTGTSGNDILSGTLDNDLLEGLGGNDSLNGLAGNDTLNGGAGNDTLDGGAGIDRLIGNIGNDLYIVDSTTDTITEQANEGKDTIRASVTFSLTALPNIENLTLTGTGNINGIGNAASNTLTGNLGNNQLNGGDGKDTLNGSAGADTLIGGIGNDTYIIDSNDTIIEAVSSGTDTIQANFIFDLNTVANIENLTLIGTANLNGTGTAGNNTLIGNSGNNQLNGGAGNDTLKGGTGNDILVGSLGNDSLTGGTGRDRFTFTSPNDKSDRITDFSVLDDAIAVSAAGFGGGLVANVATQLVIGAAATNANQRFVYDSTNGFLFFDVDGNGGTAQVQIATLSTGLLTMSSADILVLA
jgi:Ca2+-binding RTX toxin-like protein